MIYCTAALAVCYFAALPIAKTVLKKLKRNRKTETVLATVVVGAVLYCLVALGYLSVYYHADRDALNKAFDAPGITASQLSVGRAKGYSITKAGNAQALVFYAGAKVDELAYSPLMAQLADGGIDCYLVKIPFHMAMFAADAPGEFIESFSSMHYSMIMVGGHSMGGIVASQYAAKHPDAVDGIVLLASYSTAEIPQTIALCSIYGSKDGCLDLKQYESHKVNFPAESEEHIIDGGNHAQFASYGPQKGDGTATISPDTQVNETAEIICRFAKSVK